MDMNETKLMHGKVQLVLRHPFYGALVGRLKPKADPSIAGMAYGYTDGVILGYDPAWVAGANGSEIVTLLIHEIDHVAFGHLWRQGTRDRARWLAACEHVVNNHLSDMGVQLLPGALCDRKFKGMSAEQVYDKLPSVPKLSAGKPGQGKEGQGNQAQGQNQDGEGCLHPPVEGGDQSQSLEMEWRVAVLQAAQAAKAMGHLPAGLEQLVEDIKHPKVDWRPILRRFMQECAKDDYSWKSPNKRYLASGLYLPSMRSEQMPAIVVASDSSGSCWDPATQTRFASELTAIVEECRPERVYAPFCDAKVHKPVREFLPGEPLVFDVKGGGGTSFRPVFEWIDKEGIEPACLIYCTDLDGSFPAHAPDYPVLWASTERYYSVPFGEVIDISE